MSAEEKDLVLSRQSRHEHGMCPGCREIDRSVVNGMPELALCLICAYVKRPALFDSATRAAVCFTCRDGAQKKQS